MEHKVHRHIMSMYFDINIALQIITRHKLMHSLAHYTYTLQTLNHVRFFSNNILVQCKFICSFYIRH